MKQFIDFEIKPSKIDLRYGDSTVLLGSCFADEIGSVIENAGFETTVNPFGTLFHPFAIANTIKSSLNKSNDVDIFQRDDLFFSWDSASTIYAHSENELKKKLIEKRMNLYKKVKSCKLLIITFGTSWVYEHIELNKTVGNCHKHPQSNFNKTLTNTGEMIAVWKEVIALIKQVNPSIKIIFTVSPVRHYKDGLIENNRSKARLIELVHTLVDKSSYYFPSYEIIIDELRDYKFYKSDMVHPTNDAVLYVWQKFKSFAIHKDSVAIYQKREKLLQTLNHKSLHPDSKAEQLRLEKVSSQLVAFKSKHPEVNWK